MLPVILSGGAGSRLWPVSRQSHPKPFIKLRDDVSLLQDTMLRCAGLAEGPVYLVTNETYGFKTREESQALASIKSTPVLQILEPEGRNTAPAIALAALAARTRGEDPVMLVMPADHLIPDVDAFHAAAHCAEQAAKAGKIVLFGIQPTSPETGFGYIRVGSEAGHGSYDVARFVEKPDAKTASAMLDDGLHLWNSGIFCFQASVIIDALEQYAPDVLAAARTVWDNGRRDTVIAGYTDIRFDSDAFNQLPNISIDYAVMERAENIAVVRAGFSWNDIGSWKAVAEQGVADPDGNCAPEDCVLVDTSGTYIQSENRIVAAIGVQDLLVIDTKDALLIARKDCAQDVKNVVDILKKRGSETVSLHKTVRRPWGTYTVLHEGERFKMKEIVVHPEQTLSLQMHHHRAEHWIVISGTAEVTCADEQRLVFANESTYIPVGASHRLKNPGKVDLVLIEVQCGDYVGEDDIVRFEDAYGRTASLAG